MMQDKIMLTYQKRTKKQGMTVDNPDARRYNYSMCFCTENFADEWRI